MSRMRAGWLSLPMLPMQSKLMAKAWSKGEKNIGMNINALRYPCLVSKKDCALPF